MNRITHAFIFVFLFLIRCSSSDNKDFIMTVNGPAALDSMGITLTHEHILVDFAGADNINSEKWDKNAVAAEALPYLRRIKDEGCRTFIECTPAYLGRDPLLLKMLADSTGLNILTNTGYYGAGNNKYLPGFAFEETADQISDRWTKEWINGIDSTGIRPGFIKIGVSPDSLSGLHKKLLMAAARTHLKTGLTIASHTGLSIPAFQQIEILQKEGVAPDAFIWVHAQAEKDISKHISAGKMGAWISFDGIGGQNLDEYIRLIKNMRDNNLLEKVLLSHDSGWYHPGEENGGDYKGYSVLFEALVPLLKENKFTDTEIHELLVSNPAEAFRIRIRRLR